jgi:peroxiredoxin
MKNLLFVALLFLTETLTAQTTKKPAKTAVIFKPLIISAPKSTAVIKGHVKNFTDKYWELAVTGDLTNYSLKIPVDKYGNFNKVINIDGETEDIYLYLNDEAITVCAQKNDILTINWDNKNFKNTFSISSPKKGINERLQTRISIYNLYRKDITELSDTLYSDNITDSVKFGKINSLYNKEILTAATHLDHSETRKLITDIYYKYTGLLNEYGLLGKYHLCVGGNSNVAKKLNQLFGPEAYSIKSEFAYRNCNSYKYFIYSYLNSGKVLKETRINDQVLRTGIDHPVPTISGHSAAIDNLNFSGELRDWYITYMLKIKFGTRSFNDAKSIFEDLMPKVRTPRYADSLKQLYATMLLLKPGSPAPEFSLKNDKGDMISLQSLQGKVVYIDFWGVNCAPCISEIQHATPYLHERYKDKNIVFLNICVDSDEKTWKNSLASMNVEGINLIAEGWVNNSVCQKYYVTGIPHYVIIGRDGKIVNNNSARPSFGTELTNELDKALISN